MRCRDCSKWTEPKVCVGSRRVVGVCTHPGGPVTESGGGIGEVVYDFWNQCVVGVAHKNAEKDAATDATIAAQNAALDAQFPPREAAS